MAKYYWLCLHYLICWYAFIIYFRKQNFLFQKKANFIAVIIHKTDDDDRSYMPKTNPKTGTQKNQMERFGFA